MLIFTPLLFFVPSVDTDIDFVSVFRRKLFLEIVGGGAPIESTPVEEGIPDKVVKIGVFIVRGRVIASPDPKRSVAPSVSPDHIGELFIDLDPLIEIPLLVVEISVDNGFENFVETKWKHEIMIAVEPVVCQ